MKPNQDENKEKTYQYVPSTIEFSNSDYRNKKSKIFNHEKSYDNEYKKEECKNLQIT